MADFGHNLPDSYPIEYLPNLTTPPQGRFYKEAIIISKRLKLNDPGDVRNLINRGFETLQDWRTFIPFPVPLDPRPCTLKSHFNGSAFKNIFLTHVKVQHLHAVFVSGEYQIRTNSMGSITVLS